MCIGLLTMTIGIEWAFSLKQRRQALRSVKEKLKKRFNISIAEIGDSSFYNRAELAITMVGRKKLSIEPKIQNIIKFVDIIRDIELLGVKVEFL